MSYNSSYCQTDEPQPRFSPVTYLTHNTMENRAEERERESESSSVDSSYQGSGTLGNPTLVSSFM